MVNETVEGSNGFLKGRLKRLPPCVTSSSGIQPSQVLRTNERFFSVSGSYEHTYPKVDFFMVCSSYVRTQKVDCGPQGLR